VSLLLTSATLTITLAGFSILFLVIPSFSR
jgi:hypothetical protein